MIRRKINKQTLFETMNVFVTLRNKQHTS